MPFRVLARFDEQSIRADLHEGRNFIGSDPACEVVLSNATVSRRHAAVDVKGGEVILEDLQSTNGTLLRSQRIERERIVPGDVFVIGRVVVRLEEIAADDLEVGIPVGRLADPSGVAESPDERTASFSPLDHFTLDRLPKLLRDLTAEPTRQQVAQAVGHALFETMPVVAVEISDVGGGEPGILFSARGVEPDDTADEPRASTEVAPDQALETEPGSIEERRGPLVLRVRFIQRAAAEHYRPVAVAAMLMLDLADQLAGRRPPSSAQETSGVERPQPPSVELDVQRIYDQAERISRGDVGVMIYGESGTGKEVLARFIHAASPRSTQPIVAINCASLPRDLLEAELFGVERGVATGVEARPGKFEAADGGTLFLDEIGDMAPETQAKILRVLQEKEVFRLGGHTPRPARARVIAATNRPVQQMIQQGKFRSDLYHRIATWEVELPPLRRRRSDIPNLAAHFLAREAERHGLRPRGISLAALRALRRYRWPGNIRQLRNEIARAVLFLEDRELLDTGRLSAEIRGETERVGTASLASILESVERDEIASALDAARGDTAAAAEQLEISRPTLYRRIKSLGLALPGDRD
ncbi:MAG: sigma 54-interacting transcriptional regulator [Acidobacteriota bacterium]